MLDVVDLEGDIWRHARKLKWSALLMLAAQDKRSIPWTHNLGCVGLMSFPRTLFLISVNNVLRAEHNYTSALGYMSPISMAQSPVPVPMSRIRCGSGPIGARCSLPLIRSVHRWWYRSKRSSSDYIEVSERFFCESQSEVLSGTNFIVW